MKKVQYYSRQNCQLCEEGLLTMKLVQEDVAFDLQVIDIEQDDASHEKYMLMIPVVLYNNNIIQFGNIDYPTVLEILLDE